MWFRDQESASRRAISRVFDKAKPAMKRARKVSKAGQMDVIYSRKEKGREAGIYMYDL